jgi:glycerophosphoryl diester phosphodiesterase
MRVPLPAALLRAPIAHRAFHKRTEGRPENSLPAMRAAIAAGYGIECDLQLTKDGQALVFHDEWLERLTPGTGLVCDHTLAEMQAIGLQDCAEPPPGLTEMLTLVAGRVPLLIEIKDQTGAMAETDGRLEAAAAQALAGYEGTVALMSFNPHSVAHLARLAPQRPRGLTTSAYVAADWAPLDPARCDALRAIADYDRTGSSFISHEAADLGRPRVAELKAQGAAILTWTIRSPAEEAKARTVAQNITFENYAAALPA